LFDVTSSLDHVFARDLLSFLSKNELSDSEIEAYETLRKWEGEYLMMSVGPTIYNRFLFEFLENTYKDEIGDAFNLFINSQLQDQVLPAQIAREQSVWWDNIETKDVVETKQEIILRSYKNSITFFEKTIRR